MPRKITRRVIRKPAPARRTLGAPRTPAPASSGGQVGGKIGNGTVVSDQLLLSLLADSRAIAAAPPLSRHVHELAQMPKICGSCRNKRANYRLKVLRAARRTLAGLSEGQRQALKQLLGVAKLTVVVTDKRGSAPREI